MSTRTVTLTTTRFTVNGRPVEVSGPGGRRLLDVLRAELGLTGTKEGCGEGECGACAVLLDGDLVDSCLVPVCQVEGRAVRTVEGLAVDGRLDPLQAAFLDAGAAQCGFCTPGMLMAGRSFLESRTDPTDEAIRAAIAGNLCRCTGYTKIVEAIQQAATASPDGRRGHAGEPREPGEQLSRWLAEPRTAGSAGVLALPGPPAVSPRTLDEALRMLAADRLRPIAGGTDVLVALAASSRDVVAARVPDPEADPSLPLLDLSGLDELRGIRLEPEPISAGGSRVPEARRAPEAHVPEARAPGLGARALVLGALTTYAGMRRSRLVVAHLPALAEAAATVGAAQIQNRGTLGGNIVNASPAGDMLPILLATDAEIVLGSVRGERIVPAGEFWTGYRRTARAADELVLRVRIPLPAGRQVRFRKVGTRRAMAISKAVLALSWREEDGAWRDVRLALGSVAPTPIRAPRTEAVLEGASPTAETADRAAAAVAAEITPIDDVRSTADYRRTVTSRVLHRLTRDAGGW